MGSDKSNIINPVFSSNDNTETVGKCMTDRKKNIIPKQCIGGTSRSPLMVIKLVQGSAEITQLSLYTCAAWECSFGKELACNL